MAGPTRMDWPEYAAARQYLTEEFVGVRIREAKRAEDAEAQASIEALRESRR